MHHQHHRAPSPGLQELLLVVTSGNPRPKVTSYRLIIIIETLVCRPSRTFRESSSSGTYVGMILGVQRKAWKSHDLDYPDRSSESRCLFKCISISACSFDRCVSCRCTCPRFLKPCLTYTKCLQGKVCKRYRWVGKCSKLILSWRASTSNYT